MGYRAEAAETAGAASTARVALRLTRGVSASWWTTFGSVLFFATVLVLVWAAAVGGAGYGIRSVIVVGVTGLIWIAATIPLLFDYRSRDSSAVPMRRREALLPLLVAVACSAVLAVVTDVWIVAAVPVGETVVLLNWGPGIRRRVVLVVTVLLGALWAFGARYAFPADGGSAWFLVGFYSTLLPAMTVLSLWWWDVILALDRARAAEARLAATQERLRVATDVHDLQGHHLQVIALQLELAERLLEHDPEQAAAQLRAARDSVDEARQGTRDLATRFRSVPLRDELANAVDLLRAAGTTADATVDQDADRAPAAVFGPVIREATTNVLRHGGGRWARLSLTRDGSVWRLEVANDVDGPAPSDTPDPHPASGASGTSHAPDAAASGEGAGLPGIARRAAEAGGALAVERRAQSFRLTVTVPAEGAST